MKVAYEEVEQFVREEVASLTGRPLDEVPPATVLVGGNRVIDSADLVMLLLAAEDFSRDRLGAKFDWTSDSAMSEARSTLRSVETLARNLFELQAA